MASIKLLQAFKERNWRVFFNFDDKLPANFTPWKLQEWGGRKSEYNNFDYSFVFYKSLDEFKNVTGPYWLFIVPKDNKELVYFVGFSSQLVEKQKKLATNLKMVRIPFKESYMKDDRYNNDKENTKRKEGGKDDAIYLMHILVHLVKQKKKDINENSLINFHDFPEGDKLKEFRVNWANKIGRVKWGDWISPPINIDWGKDEEEPIPVEKDDISAVQLKYALENIVFD